ncbi:SDR family oxidoreductase [Ilumatobacter sp.]|uniref:SDR family oxidoreductase n=1 Tax=Ilumatobacter sp. TaxID=1967498 RepID=UPI003B523225
MPNLTTVIIGGSGAMGSAIAQHIAAAGHDVILIGRDQGRLNDAHQRTGATQTIAADFGDASEAKRVLDELGVIDHLVVATSAGPVRASSIPATVPSEFQRAHGRLWTSFNAVHFAPDHVRPGGSVTLISGSSGRRPGIGFGVWTSLHGSIEALARAATIELAPIRVNVVSPGGIGMQPDRQLIERRGTGDDIGLAVASLIANPAITGAVLDVDSGERLGTWPT